MFAVGQTCIPAQKGKIFFFNFVFWLWLLQKWNKAGKMADELVFSLIDLSFLISYFKKHKHNG